MSKSTHGSSVGLDVGASSPSSRSEAAGQESAKVQGRGSCCSPASGCCGPTGATKTGATPAGTPIGADVPAAAPSPPAGPAPSPASARPATTTSRDVIDDILRRQVREGYAKIAQGGGWSLAGPGAASAPASAAPAAGPSSGPSSGCTPGGGCCGPATFTPEQLAQAIGYASGELDAAPEGANLGLSCGNPTALASLRPGEVVLDLGAGAGFDCFIAGPKVGPTGRAIGVDMTPDMLSKARASIPAYTQRSGLSNVEFRLGEIENLPVADASVDVVISNCVLNLSPDKARVWKEIARVLRPGGRVAISDLALLRPLPEAVRADVEALVGCVAGAVLVEESIAQAHAAGLVDIDAQTSSGYTDAMTGWDDPLYRKIMAALPAGRTPADYVTSLSLTARRGPIARGSTGERAIASPGVGG